MLFCLSVPGDSPSVSVDLLNTCGDTWRQVEVSHNVMGRLLTLQSHRRAITHPQAFFGK